MEFLEQMDIDFVAVAIRLGLVVVVLIIGRWLAGAIKRLLLRSLQKTELTESLNTLIVTLSYYGILLLTVMIALAILGVPVATLVTAVGVVVVILAIALQQSLGNLAATINFLLFKPFEIGDIVETMGILGIVQEIQMFSTVIVSADHRTHVLPNAAIQGAGLANYSKIGTVRVDLLYDIGYTSDMDKAKEVIGNILAADERVIQEPPPEVFVAVLAESSVQIAAWPFVEIGDFLNFRSDITEQVKRGLDEAGIEIPFPQRDIHLIKAGES